MQPLNINTVILRSLISFGVVVSNLYTIKVLPASAQSSASERIECIKKFAEYYRGEGGYLSTSDALAKAEQTCASARFSASERIECIKKFAEYYRGEGGYLSRSNALVKAERTCAEESNKSNGQSVPSNNIPSPGGSPQAITDCMKRLMYERKLVCTRSGFPGCSHFPSEGFAGWQTQDVRTDISDAVAVQACQNAR